MTDPGQSLAITEWLALFGIKAVTLVAAFFGASVALVGTPRLNIWQLIVSILGGMAFAVYLEPLITHLFGLPSTVQGAIAFLLGLTGLILSAGAMQVSRALPRIAMAWLESKFGGRE